MFSKRCTFHGARPNSGGSFIGSSNGTRQSQGRVLLPEEIASAQVFLGTLSGLTLWERFCLAPY